MAVGLAVGLLLALTLAGCIEDAAPKRAPRRQLREETYYDRIGTEFRRSGSLMGVVVEGRDVTKPPPDQTPYIPFGIPRTATNVTINVSWAPTDAPEELWVGLMAREFSRDPNGRFTTRYTPVAEKDGPSKLTLTYSAAKLGYTSYRIQVEPRSDCICDFTYDVTAHFWGPKTRNVEA